MSHDGLDDSTDASACATGPTTIASTIALIAREGSRHHVPRAAALRSGLLLSVLEHDPDAIEVPLQQLSARDLQRCVAYMRHHEHKEPSPIPCPLPSCDLNALLDDTFDAALVTKLCRDDLFSLAEAANYLHIEALLDLVCAQLGSMLKNKTADEVAHLLSLSPNLTADEEELIHSKNAWKVSESTARV